MVINCKNATPSIKMVINYINININLRRSRKREFVSPLWCEENGDGSVVFIRRKWETKMRRNILK